MSVRHRIEFAALLAVRRLVNGLPHRGALALGWLLAIIGFRVLRYRRAEAERRIRSVFGDSVNGRTPAGVAWEAFRNLMFTAVEAMRAEAITLEWMERHLQDPGGLFGELKALTARGGGAIVALPHMGSWELAGASCRVRGIPLFSIAARQKNPYFTDYLNRQRDRSGIEILVRGDSSLRAVLRNLKAGKCFAILPDVRQPAPGIVVPFLGSTANVAPGMALFARQAGVPVYAAILTRQGWDRHTVEFAGPFRPDPAAPRDEDAARLTREVFACFNAAIRRNPGQWFWFNKRWILDPVPDPFLSAPASNS